MTVNDLLVELLTEELPPKALAALSESLGQQVHQTLLAKGLAGTHSTLTIFATPRRLALRISGVPQKPMIVTWI